jgi:hypothetical protein
VELMRFWLDKGVAGFRMDVIPFVSKHEALPDLTPEQLDQPELVYASGPRVHEHLQRLQREALAPCGAVSVGEACGVGLDEAPLFTVVEVKGLWRTLVATTRARRCSGAPRRMPASPRERRGSRSIRTSPRSTRRRSSTTTSRSTTIAAG